MLPTCFLYSNLSFKLYMHIFILSFLFVFAIQICREERFLNFTNYYPKTWQLLEFIDQPNRMIFISPNIPNDKSSILFSYFCLLLYFISRELHSLLAFYTTTKDTRISPYNQYSWFSRRPIRKTEEITFPGNEANQINYDL